MTEALQPGLRVRGYVLNTLLAEKMVDDRLRSYPHWLASRNLANEASDESVAGLIEAVRNRYELPRRWYRLKAQLLGVDRLADYDRMASVTDEDESIPWATAKEMVLDSFADFAPELADTRARVLRRPAHRRARCARASAAARSAPTPCRARRPTCCSTTPRAAATCSRSRTSSATACTPRWRATRACSTSRRR